MSSSLAPAAGQPLTHTDYPGLQPVQNLGSPLGRGGAGSREQVAPSEGRGRADEPQSPGPRVARRSLAEIDLEAHCERALMEIDYLYGVGLISHVEAQRRRLAAYEFFKAAMTDLRSWLSLAGC